MTNTLMLAEFPDQTLIHLGCRLPDDAVVIRSFTVDEIVHRERWCPRCDQRFVSLVDEARYTSNDHTLAAVDLLRDAQERASRDGDLAGEKRANDAWRHLLGLTVSCFACGGTGQVPDDLDDLHDCFTCRGEAFRRRLSDRGRFSVGTHVMMDWQGRRLLGEVLRDHYTTLTVRHFNGELWPVRPRREEVQVLR